MKWKQAAVSLAAAVLALSCVACGGAGTEDNGERNGHDADGQAGKGIKREEGRS